MKGMTIMEKRIKLIAGIDGTNKIETISGFAGNECHETIDLIIGGINNAKTTDSGDTDDMYRSVDSNVYNISDN